ncbi:MAG: carboxymuconolactone decarboxylase family protein [Planctomycetota bacterium]|jgi:AhpD family alkylhydroperoxidase
MDERTKELVAVGASVTANCQPCLRYHMDKAQTLGASEHDIQEAVAAGRMVRAGAAAKFDRFAESTLVTAAPAASEKTDCGSCG